MATLTMDKPRTYEGNQQYNSYSMIASDIIYKGAAVGDNGSGYARPLVAGDPFYGFAQGQVDNSTGAAGAKRIWTNTEGLIQLDVATVTGVGDIGDKVYASDDNTFTKVSTSNTLIGIIVRHISGTTCTVRYSAHGQVV